MSAWISNLPVLLIEVQANISVDYRSLVFVLVIVMFFKYDEFLSPPKRRQAHLVEEKQELKERRRRL